MFKGANDFKAYRGLQAVCDYFPRVVGLVQRLPVQRHDNVAGNEMRMRVRARFDFEAFAPGAC